MENLYLRVSRLEALANKHKSELMETMLNAYQAACEDNNEEVASDLVRKIRNTLLDASDKEMTLDRLGLDTSSPIKFVQSLSKITQGAWSTYRQKLRDVPQQAGFPFNIDFPESPLSKKENELSPHLFNDPIVHAFKHEKENV